MKNFPSFNYEKPYWSLGRNVLGIDEAGRGAFAGPLSVAGVVFSKKLAGQILELGINDSKLLTAKKRESLYYEIKKNSIFSHVELVSLDTINSVGIGRATTLGMQEVFKKAYNAYKNIFLLIDAFKIPDYKDQKALIHGDRLSISIAAASILAKVERDRYMKRLASKFGFYSWEKNKGYGTLIHRNALKKFGPSIYHRTQFVAKFI